MHPLSYQTLPMSCWVTSMINGILFQYQGKLVPFMAYKVLHNIMTADGVLYYTKGQKNDLDGILRAVESCSKLDIDYYTGESVEEKVRGLDYKKQVAVCDIGSGDHSILVNGFKDGIFDAFEPYWDNVKNGDSSDGEYETFPPYMSGSKNTVNLRVSARHFFKEKNGPGFRMGAKSKRFAVVLTKR